MRVLSSNVRWKVNVPFCEAPPARSFQYMILYSIPAAALLLPAGPLHLRYREAELMTSHIISSQTIL